MNTSTTACMIAGGIDVISDSVISGGQERVVGENTKWYMRNKFIQLKHLASSNADEKSLLKIVGLSIPITFGKKIKVYYDDDKNKIPTVTKKESVSEKQKKALEILDSRLDNNIDTIVKRAVIEYKLHAPLIWVLGDIVKFLAVVNKKKKPNTRKIKISPDMAVLIEKIWRGKNYFQYVINTDDVPSNMIDLMIHMLELIQKNNPPRGKWVEPILDIIKYPCFCKINKSQLEVMIDNEKKDLVKRVSSLNPLDAIKEKILTILTIENLLVDHIDSIEKYYVVLAKNMSKIYDSLKVFFKKS